MVVSLPRHINRWETTLKIDEVKWKKKFIIVAQVAVDIVWKNVKIASHNRKMILAYNYLMGDRNK